MAGEVIDVDTPGICSANLATLPYAHLTRPIFPLDDAEDIGLPAIIVN